MELFADNDEWTQFMSSCFNVLLSSMSCCPVQCPIIFLIGVCKRPAVIVCFAGKPVHLFRLKAGLFVICGRLQSRLLLTLLQSQPRSCQWHSLWRVQFHLYGCSASRCSHHLKKQRLWQQNLVIVGWECEPKNCGCENGLPQWWQPEPARPRQVTI